MKSRSLEPLKKLKKENLVKVTAYFGITQAVIATKSYILDLIEDHCIENYIIDEVQKKPTAEVLKLKLEFEHEERRLACERACEEAQKACDAGKAAHEEARELRWAELKEACELRELELKAEKEKALLAAKLEAAACEHELNLRM